MSERDIKKKIRNYLKTISDSKFFPYNPMYGESGIPDIIGCYKGKFIAIEVKQPGKKLTRLQEMKLREINRAGGLAFVATSVQDVERNFVFIKASFYK